jgi:hypothetical protein
VLSHSLRTCPPLYLAAFGYLATAVDLLAAMGIDWRADQWRAEQGGLPQKRSGTMQLSHG